MRRALLRIGAGDDAGPATLRAILPVAGLTTGISEPLDAAPQQQAATQAPQRERNQV
jgi:hypothetical protein